MVSIDSKLTTKSPKEIEIMTEGGKRLTFVRDKLKNSLAPGVNAYEVDKLADDLIRKAHGEPSFKMVAGYYWATCINVNDGVVHGIPKKSVVFKKGDVVSVDAGFFYKGFHTDTSFSIALEPTKQVKKFLLTGEIALRKAIKAMQVGGKIYDISSRIQEAVEANGYSPIRALVGHGIGRSLHEEPQIPCFRIGEREESLELVPGMVFAIEVMYTAGSGDVVRESDGWTISTADGKISALFEETVALTRSGPLVLTVASNFGF